MVHRMPSPRHAACVPPHSLQSHVIIPLLVTEAVLPLLTRRPDRSCFLWSRKAWAVQVGLEVDWGHVIESSIKIPEMDNVEFSSWAVRGCSGKGEVGERGLISRNFARCARPANCAEKIAKLLNRANRGLDVGSCPGPRKRRPPRSS